MKEYTGIIVITIITIIIIHRHGVVRLVVDFTLYVFTVYTRQTHTRARARTHTHTHTQVKRGLEHMGDDEALEAVEAFEVKYTRLREKYKQLERSSGEEADSLAAQLQDAQDEVERLRRSGGSGGARGGAGLAPAQLRELEELRRENEAVVQQLVAKQMELAELHEQQVGAVLCVRVGGGGGWAVRGVCGGWAVRGVCGCGGWAVRECERGCEGRGGLWPFPARIFALKHPCSHPATPPTSPATQAALKRDVCHWAKDTTNKQTNNPTHRRS